MKWPTCRSSSLDSTQGNCSRRFLHGFTLIELLVVIAIISLLVSILLPSLNKAKDLAKQVVCATNLRNNGMVLNMYATDSDGYLPPFQNTYEGIYVPGRTYCVYLISGSLTPCNMGILYSNGYVSDPRAFYCSDQPAQIFAYEYYPQPWGSSGVGGVIRSGYLYNPHVDETGSAYRYRRLADMPADKTLCMDMVNGASAIAHQGRGWNLLFSGGDVSFKQSQEAYDYIVDVIPNASGWIPFGIVLEMLKECE